MLKKVLLGFMEVLPHNKFAPTCLASNLHQFTLIHKIQGL